MIPRKTRKVQNANASNYHWRACYLAVYRPSLEVQRYKSWSSYTHRYEEQSGVSSYSHSPPSQPGWEREVAERAFSEGQKKERGERVSPSRNQCKCGFLGRHTLCGLYRLSESSNKFLKSATCAQTSQMLRIKRAKGLDLWGNRTSAVNGPKVFSGRLCR